MILPWLSKFFTENGTILRSGSRVIIADNSSAFRVVSSSLGRSKSFSNPSLSKGTGDIHSYIVRCGESSNFRSPFLYC